MQLNKLKLLKIIKTTFNKEKHNMKYSFVISILLLLLSFNFSIAQQRITNGDFEKGTSPWVLELHSPATGTYNIDSSANMSGVSSGHITITNSDGTDWHLQFQELIGAVTQGNKYNLSFQAFATEPVTITAWIQQYHGSYTILYSKSFNITTDNQLFQDSVVMTTGDSNVKFAFTVGALKTNDEIWFDAVSLLETVVTSVESNRSNIYPDNFILMQNYPNPFNPTTTIEFSLPEKSDVHLVLVNVLGQVVKEIANGNYSTGDHRVTLDASRLASGIYFYKIRARQTSGGDLFTDTKKLVLMK